MGKNGGSMKNRLIYYLFLISYFFKAEKVSAKYRKSTSEIDPMIDFRTPYSLNELLHEGLIEVSKCFNQISFVQDANSSELLTRSQITISAMIDSYDAMIDSSKLHAVYRDDKDFLQTLIDRIDNLIQELENGKKLSELENQMLYKNIESLNILRDKLKN